ncbi:MAG: class I SAM-dependent methyltransferase [Erysipelotrichaceae bacterium]|nr:class I SAM-dependent methyltransferase [Solobacterium sp.]MDY5401246.1 class I SAM-dependent methyltransferase [Erysipelotrichaceae bacterium]
MKYKIKKDSVQETLIIPLYSRKICSSLYPNIYYDKTAVDLISQIDYDFSEIEKKSKSLMQRFGALEVAARQSDIAYEVCEYLKEYPSASVVNLGCGLDNTGRNCDNGKCKIYNLDFPDVIKLRNELLPPEDREENIACNLNDVEWFDKIDNSNGVIFFASGVFYYFLNEEVKSLIIKMANYFNDSVLVFDAAGKTTVKLISIWLNSLKVKEVGTYFSVSNLDEISSWSNNIEVSSKGYMLGYNDLKQDNISGFFRFLAHICDGLMKMKIVKIKFKGTVRN